MAAPDLNESSLTAGAIGVIIGSIPLIGQWIIKRMDVGAASRDSLRDDLIEERNSHREEAGRWRVEAEKERHNRLKLELSLNEALIQVANIQAALDVEKRARVSAEERITALEARLAELERRESGE